MLAAKKTDEMESEVHRFARYVGLGFSFFSLGSKREG